MSEQTSIWTPGKSGADWRRCKRYNLTISGCTRNFECSICYELFPNPRAVSMAQPNGLKQIGFGMKQIGSSFKMVGVTA